MIIFLHGPDTFRSRRQLKKMVEKFKADRDPQGLNVVRMDCVKEEPSKIMEQILTSPFLAEKRLVVLENFLSMAGDSCLQEDMLKRVSEETLPDSTVLVFWEEDPKLKADAAKKLFELLNKEKLSQRFDLLAGAKLQAWIEAEIRTRGGKINRPALQYLARNIGSDMWKLDSLAWQLVNYAEGRTRSGQERVEIMVEDIRLFLDERTDDDIFGLIDAIVAGQAKRAYEMMREQYRKGKDAGYLFAMILRQFRILVEIRDLYEREDNLPSDLIAKKLDLHPFVVKKSIPFVRRYTLHGLKNVYQRLLDIDIKTKTGLGDQSLLLDVFVGRLALN